MQKHTVSILVLAVLSLGVHSARSLTFSHHQSTQQYEDIYYLPPHDWLVLATTGYQEGGAAALWLKALVYLGDELGHRTGAQYLYHYSNAITALDPNFRRVYLWTAAMALYRPQGPTIDDARRAIQILEQAVVQFPADGELIWQLGAVHAYEMPPLLNNETEALAEEIRGRELFRVASLLGGGPPWSALNAASGLTALGKTEQARRHLMEIYETIDGEVAKQQLEIRLERLNSEAFVLALRATVEEFRRSHQTEYSYVDDGLFYLLRRHNSMHPNELLTRHFDPLLSSAQ